MREHGIHFIRNEATRLATGCATAVFFGVAWLAPQNLWFSVVFSAACAVAVVADRMEGMGRSRRRTADGGVRVGSGPGGDVVLSHADVSAGVGVTGITGSGKTEFLLLVAEQEIAAGRGVVFVDGTGDVATYLKLMTVAAHAGRRDEVALLNFMATDRDGTDTMLPLAGLDADGVCRIVLGTAEAHARGGDPDRGSFHARSRSFLRTCLILRDEPVRTLEDLKRSGWLSLEAVLGKAGGVAQGPAVRYLATVEGFDAGRGAEQRSEILAEHRTMAAYVEAHVERLASFATPVFDDGPLDVDVRALVETGGILCVMLPASEKADGDVSFVLDVLEEHLAVGPARRSVSDGGVLIVDEGLSTVGVRGRRGPSGWGRVSCRQEGIFSDHAVRVMLRSATEPGCHDLQQGEGILVRGDEAVRFEFGMADVNPVGLVLDRKVALDVEGGRGA